MVSGELKTLLPVINWWNSQQAGSTPGGAVSTLVVIWLRLTQKKSWNTYTSMVGILRMSLYFIGLNNKCCQCQLLVFKNCGGTLTTFQIEAGIEENNAFLAIFCPYTDSTIFRRS